MAKDYSGWLKKNIIIIIIVIVHHGGFQIIKWDQNVVSTQVIAVITGRSNR